MTDRTSQTDAILTFLAKAAEGITTPRTGSVSWETPVTLNVHGAILVGRIVSFKSYMEALAGAVSAPDPDANSWKYIVEVLRNTTPPEQLNPGSHASLPAFLQPAPPEPRYLYLKDGAGAVWRIYLSDISAWAPVAAPPPAAPRLA